MENILLITWLAYIAMYEVRCRTILSIGLILYGAHRSRQQVAGVPY